MGLLDGRVVLVTGAGRGIGRAEALYCAAEGARVVVNDPGVAPDGSAPDPGLAEEVVAEIVAAGGTAVASTDSVADWAGAERMVTTAIEEFGDLHVLINNATLHRIRGLTEMTEDEFDDVVAVKLRGTFAVSRAAARHWRDRHLAGERVDRAIVNTASGSGLTNPLPAQTNYAAANAGAGAMTLVHALELARHGVRVNCIAPSMVRTRLTAGLPLAGVTAAPTESGYDPQDPRHQAVVAAYLASPLCPFTGQVLSVRGGAVTVLENWAPGAQVQRDGSEWTPTELAAALAEQPIEDPLDKLTAQFGRALGVTDRSQLQQWFDSILDRDTPLLGRR